MRASRSSPPAQTSGPTVIGSRGPMRSASAPARAERSSISAVTGQERGPRGERLEPGDDLQVEDEQEEHAAERRVDREGDEVRAAERARPEHLEREHRVA